MIEQQLRAITTEEPPLGFDPDVVVSRIATATRRRRTVIGSALVVTAVLGVGALVPTLRPSEHPQAVAGAGGGGGGGESEAWEKHLVEVLPKIAPQVKDVRKPGSPGVPSDGGWAIPVGYSDMSKIPPEPVHAKMFAVLGNGYTNVMVERFSNWPEYTDLNRVCERTTAESVATCTKSVLADGSTAFDITAGPHDEYENRDVLVFRADGSMIYASSDVNQREPGQHPLALTLQQLRQLATDPVFAR